MIEQKSWDDFLEQTQEGNFLQRWFWGELQQSLGKKIWRIRIGDSKILLQAQIIEEKLFSQLSYLYLPFGPVFQSHLSPSMRQEAERRFLKRIRDLGKERKSIFLRIEPREAFLLPSFSKNPPLKRIQPQKTRLLDLRPSLAEIQKGFSVRSRYNIRLAQRKGLKLIRCQQLNPANKKYLIKFNQLIQATSQRKHFHVHPQSYYQALLTKAISEGWGELFLAEYQEEIIGAYFLVTSHQWVTCLHGAVDYRYRFAKASHFLQWEQIKAAKEKGCLVYDFWGIDKKLWPGVSFFKESFGGQTIEYPRGSEIILRPGWYFLYKLYRKIRNHD